MPKLVGYARVSMNDQDVQFQLNALEAAGCAKNKIFIDTISGVHTDRPGLEAARAGFYRYFTL
jgi:DNA invertase Pin-like site-specific DNA recombinase